LRPDLAILTGGLAITEDLGLKLENVTCGGVALIRALSAIEKIECLSDEQAVGVAIIVAPALGHPFETRVHDGRADIPKVPRPYENPGRDHEARSDTQDSGPPRNPERSPAPHLCAPPSASRAFGYV